MFGEKLKLAMDAKGYNQRQLGLKTGIMECSINKWLHNTRKPNADNIIILCNELDISADWLLELKE